MTTNTHLCNHETSDGNVDDPTPAYCSLPASHAGAHDYHVPVAESHTSKAGKARIIIRERVPGVWHPPMRFQVYALDGHETLPATRNFNDEAEARSYANVLWARY